MTMKMIGEMSGVPTRETALLIAEAMPEFCTGTEPIRVVVSGATTSEMPTPNNTTAGRMSTIVENGGTMLARLSNRASHGALVTGTRAYQSNAMAMRIGPMVRKG